MPSAEFYLLQDPNKQIEFVSLLCAKAWRQYRSVSVIGDLPDLERLDKTLWQNSADSFLPHVLGKDKNVIQLLQDSQLSIAPIVINLTQQVLLNTPCERMLEIYSDHERPLARQVYSQYRNAGFDMKFHLIQ